MDVRREVVLYSRQWGIGAFGPSTFPERTSTGARSRWSRMRTSSSRFAYSSSVRNCRVPNCAGRSNGTPYSPSAVHSPCRSGSPHSVRPVAAPVRLVWALTSPGGPARCIHADMVTRQAAVVRTMRITGS